MLHAVVATRDGAAQRTTGFPESDSARGETDEIVQRIIKEMR